MDSDETCSYRHHEGVRRVHEEVGGAFGRALQAELAVGGHRVVQEHDGAGERRTRSMDYDLQSLHLQLQDTNWKHNVMD